MRIIIFNLDHKITWWWLKYHQTTKLNQIITQWLILAPMGKEAKAIIHKTWRELGKACNRSRRMILKFITSFKPFNQEKHSLRRKFKNMKRDCKKWNKRKTKWKHKHQALQLLLKNKKKTINHLDFERVNKFFW